MSLDATHIRSEVLATAAGKDILLAFLPESQDSVVLLDPVRLVASLLNSLRIGVLEAFVELFHDFFAINIPIVSLNFKYL